MKGGMTIPNIATFDHGTYIHQKYIQHLTERNLSPIEQ